MELLTPQLQAFLAVMNHRSVSHAAGEVALTQTAVTQRIKALESHLGVTLFVRSRRGMAPTPDAFALKRYCDAVDELGGQLKATLNSGAGAAVSRIAITGPSSILRSRIIPSISAVLKQHTQVRVSFELSDLESGAVRLRSGAADIAIVRPEDVVREFDSRLLRSERYILVGPSQWKSRRLQDIVSNEPIVDFDPTDRMTFLYLEKFGLGETGVGERHFVNNTDALAGLVASGFGYSVLAEEFAREWISRGTLVALNGGKAYEYKIAAAWYPRPVMSKHFRDLLSAVR